MSYLIRPPLSDPCMCWLGSLDKPNPLSTSHFHFISSPLALPYFKSVFFSLFFSTLLPFLSLSPFLSLISLFTSPARQLFFPSSISLEVSFYHRFFSSYLQSSPFLLCSLNVCTSYLILPFHGLFFLIFLCFILFFTVIFLTLSFQDTCRSSGGFLSRIATSTQHHDLSYWNGYINIIKFPLYCI